MILRGRLGKRASELGVSFVDLTPAFRARKSEVLFLAPVDFHPNPRGYGVIASAIADHLMSQGLAGE